MWVYEVCPDGGKTGRKQRLSAREGERRREKDDDLCDLITVGRANVRCFILLLKLLEVYLYK